MTDELRTDTRATDECRSCGVPSAPVWDTSDGRVRLCPPCAAVHGVGCP